MKNRILFREGLLKEISGKWVLVGVKCKPCGRVFFPKREVCLNCLSHDLENLNLSQTGKLYSFTIVHMPSEHFTPPYAVGWIDLPEGIRIFSLIQAWKENPLRIGMTMKLSVEKIWEEEEKEVMGYVFKPAENDGGPLEE